MSLMIVNTKNDLFRRTSCAGKWAGVDIIEKPTDIKSSNTIKKTTVSSKRR
jgi:hypothetical protein